LLCAFRKRDADRLDLVNRSISRVELSRQIIKANITAGVPEFPFPRGSHFLAMNLTPDASVAHILALRGVAAPQFGILSGAKNRKNQSEMFRFAQHRRCGEDGCVTADPSAHSPEFLRQSERRRR